MPSATTTIVETFAARTPDVIGHNEPDDHLRVAALLAHSQLPTDQHWVGDPIHDQRASVCLDPSTPWPARLEALTELLSERVGELVIGDIDALFPGTVTNEARWNDLHMTRERAEFFDTLLTIARTKPGWVFVRTVNNPDVSRALVDKGLSPDADDADTGLACDVPAVLSPEVRPAARWLVERGLRPKDLERMTEAADSPDEALAAATFDHLPFSARIAAMKFAVVRTAADLNGHLGRFSLGDNSEHSVSADAVGLLRQAGLLVNHGQGRVRMPRTFRSYFRRWARVEPSVRTHQLHTWLAEPEDETPGSIVEAHHHAVGSGNVDAAFETARFYSRDLRRLAYALSRREEFDASAQVYSRMVNQHDDKDAYAWEYLAWNLARHHGVAMPDEVADEIESAYSTAHRLDRRNPLYHGRLLGFRAQRGLDVLAEFNRHARAYEQLYDLDGLGWFARPVLTGLRRGNQSEAFATIKHTWGGRLRQNERVREVLEPA